MPAKPKRKLPPIDLGNMTIGQRIANFRKNHGFTQNQLAEKMGLTQSIISDYETGRLRLYDEMVARFAIALNVSTDDLLGLTVKHKDNTKISLRIMKRVTAIEELPETRKKAILKTIDDLIKANTT